MRNDKKIEHIIEKAKLNGDKEMFKNYIGKPFIRPRSALETNISAF